jgi:fumarate hydratase class I
MKPSRQSLLAAALVGPLGAHGDDQRVLELLTAELARAPDADLHLRRGELHRHLRDWERAEADYAAAARLAPELALVAYFRARARLEAGDPAVAAFVADCRRGGTSAEATLKTVKLASTRYLDALPTEGSEKAQAFRDLEMEKVLLQKAREIGIGAQFGGKFFALDVRVIRLPRHGASCPVGLGVSCSADRQAKAKITKDGIFLEQLETNPGQYIPEKWRDHQFHGVPVDLNLGMAETLETLSKYPVTTALELTGTIIVARDIAHAKLREMVERGEELPAYFKEYPVYYAGPAKTPDGMPSGSFGPTTAGRMDPYVDLFQSQGASMVMIAKGNRSQQVTDACKKHGGFYLGSIGGPAAILAQNHIKKVEVLDFPELGMEAVWKIEVKDFPAFVVVDDKGNDFFAETLGDGGHGGGGLKVVR